MHWDPANSIKELAWAVDTFDHPGAEELCDALINSARSGETVFPENDARKALGILRRKRYFDLLQRVAEELIENGQNAAVVQRQYAQALIDQGQLTVAASLLRQLAEDTRGDSVEHAEARGLLGRVYRLGSGHQRATTRTAALPAQAAVRRRLEERLIDHRRKLLPQVSPLRHNLLHHEHRQAAFRINQICRPVRAPPAVAADTR